MDVSPQVRIMGRKAEKTSFYYSCRLVFAVSISSQQTFMRISSGLIMGMSPLDYVDYIPLKVMAGTSCLLEFAKKEVLP